mmetsp:Transcript_142398/g.201502  ORF Transcript_142398/g.201502 Transcript_142398/m.201502 type:complete len:204 (-) Transcript_142398:24-635(-)
MVFHPCPVDNRKLMCASTLTPTVSSMSPPLRSPPVRRTRSPLPMIRDVFPKTRLSAWLLKPRSTRPRTMPTRTVSRPRTDWRTIATLSSPPSPRLRLRARSLPMTRPLLRARSRRPSAGSTAILLPRRKSTKRSKRPLKELPCQSCNPWLALLEVCLEVLCPIWVACLEVLLQPMIRLVAPPLRRSTKRRVLPVSVVDEITAQ